MLGYMASRTTENFSRSYLSFSRACALPLLDASYSSLKQILLQSLPRKVLWFVTPIFPNAPQFKKDHVEKGQLFPPELQFVYLRNHKSGCKKQTTSIENHSQFPLSVIITLSPLALFHLKVYVQELLELHNAVQSPQFGEKDDLALDVICPHFFLE